MTQMTVDQPSTRRAARAAQHAQGRRSLRWAAVAIALLGGMVFSYPLGAQWIADVIQANAVAHYETSSGALDPQTRADLLAGAREYNEHLPNGPLRDPFVLDGTGQAVSLEQGRDEYERQLRPAGSDADGPIARLRIDAIDVDLPIYAGTDERTLARGVGHLYGSGLPVGGAGVHSVLTAHSGYVESRLFDDLHELAVGDVFTISVLGEVLTYRVDRITTALPDESEQLRQVSGEDHVTLVTCTPRFVNTHRLLVRGVRVPTASSPQSTGGETRSGRDPGLPGWILAAAGPAVAALLLTRPRRAGAPRQVSPAPAVEEGVAVPV